MDTWINLPRFYPPRFYLCGFYLPGFISRILYLTTFCKEFHLVIYIFTKARAQKALFSNSENLLFFWQWRNIQVFGSPQFDIQSHRTNPSNQNAGIWICFENNKYCLPYRTHSIIVFVYLLLQLVSTVRSQLSQNLGLPIVLL